MIQTIRKAWGIPELRKKMVFTLLILLIFRIGNAITVPYVNVDMLEQYLDQMGGTILGLYNVMSGGAFATATVFALSIQPYINSSIIIQLLTVAIPALERLAREGGEEGRKKIQSITRYTTVGIAILQAFGYYMLMRSNGLLATGADGIWPALVIIVSFIAGSSFVMWMGEQVTEFGVGNGISVILFAGILSRVPSMVGAMAEGVGNWGSGMESSDTVFVLHPALLVLLLVGILALIVFIVFINDSERRIPIQYAKRQVGRKMYGGQSSYLPMKVNMSGVLPIIFAQSIASLRHPRGGDHLPEHLRRHQHPVHHLYGRVFHHDHRIQLFLLHHPVQPRGDRQQPEEAGRLHSGLPSRQAHRGLHQEGPQQDHHVRRSLSRRRGHLPADPGQGDRQLLSGDRRHVRHHRGGRGPGNCQGPGGPDADASIQGFPGIREKAVF